jgi:hypothetical protein
LVCRSSQVRVTSSKTENNQREIDNFGSGKVRTYGNEKKRKTQKKNVKRKKSKKNRGGGRGRKRKQKGSPHTSTFRFH